jgi:hypothetical protein
MVVLATHPSEGLVRDVHGERHGVVTVPPRGHATASCTAGQSTQLICVPNFRARMVTPYISAASPRGQVKIVVRRGGLPRGYSS